MTEQEAIAVVIAARGGTDPLITENLIQGLMDGGWTRLMAESRISEAQRKGQRIAQRLASPA